VGRHIVRDHHHGSEWFGAKEEGEDFVFWFKLKQDRDKAEIFLAEIQENGIPKNRN
jgi:hypothetical protein